MKRLFLLIITLFVCIPLVACEEEILEGSGKGIDAGAVSENVTSDIPEETAISISVSWVDYVLIDESAYIRDRKNTEFDLSKIGDCIGKIAHNPKHSYDSQEEYEADGKFNYSAAFRSIGSEIYLIKDAPYSIAVLDGGEYYLYTRRTESIKSIVDVRGYVDFSINDVSGACGVCIDSYEALCAEIGRGDLKGDEYYGGFDAEYFKDHTLIMVDLPSGWGGSEFGIKSVTESEDSLKVNAVRFDSSADGNTAMHSWRYFITVNKTEKKAVSVNVEKADPIAEGVSEIKYEDINKYMGTVDRERLRVYEGQAITTEAALREHIYTKYGSGCQIENINISYEPAQMYWFAEFRAQSGCDIMIYELVIRAADGKSVNLNW